MLQRGLGEQRVSCSWRRKLSAYLRGVSICMQHQVCYIVGCCNPDSFTDQPVCFSVMYQRGLEGQGLGCSPRRKPSGHLSLVSICMPHQVRSCSVSASAVVHSRLLLLSSKEGAGSDCCYAASSLPGVIQLDFRCQVTRQAWGTGELTAHSAASSPDNWGLSASACNIKSALLCCIVCCNSNSPVRVEPVLSHCLDSPATIYEKALRNRSAPSAASSPDT